MQLSSTIRCNIFLITLSLIYLVTPDLSAGLECYKCDPCPSNETNYPKETCSKGENCLSLSLNLEIYGLKLEGTSKGCANASLTCNDIVYADLNSTRDQLQPDLQAVFDQNLPDIKCNFCGTDLCN